MARRYTRRYRRGRKYYRRRIPRKRFIRGIDRNTFCIVNTDKITYSFKENEVIGYPNKYINFGVYRVKINDQQVYIATSIVTTDKFTALARLYDKVRLKGMSVKISYVAATGLSAQTLNLITAVDRCTTAEELKRNYTYMKNQQTSYYRDKIDNAASRKKISLTGGKTVYYYYYPTSIQEKEFINIDDDNLSSSLAIYNLDALNSINFNGFNPCIFSYIEKSATAETEPTSVVVSIEVKYYVEFRSSC